MLMRLRSLDATLEAVCEAAGCAVIDQNTGAPMRYNREELLNAWFLVSREESLGS